MTSRKVDLTDCHGVQQIGSAPDIGTGAVIQTVVFFYAGVVDSRAFGGSVIRFGSTYRDSVPEREGLLWHMWAPIRKRVDVSVRVRDAEFYQNLVVPVRWFRSLQGIGRDTVPEDR